MSVGESSKLPICSDCPNLEIKSRLEKLAIRSNALDQGLYTVAGQLLTAIECQGPKQRKTQYFGDNVLDCGNYGISTTTSLTEQVMSVTDRFRLYDKPGIDQK